MKPLVFSVCAAALALTACAMTPTPLPAVITAAPRASAPAPLDTAAPPTTAPLPTLPPAPTAAPAVFTLALPSAPASLDPAQAEDEAGLLITRHLYEGLTTFEPGTTRVRPALAESWAASTDGLTWTFKIRAGVLFSDGTPLTAEAARQNFERWRTPTPAGRYVFYRLMFGGFAGETDEAGAPLETVAAVTATTPTELIITLRRPDAALPNTLAMPAFALVSPAAWTAPNFGQPGAPSAGAGPFQIKRWQTPELVELERNPVYWGAPAKPDGLRFKTIADDVQRVTALQVGEVDGLARLPASAYDLAQRWPQLRVEFDPALEVLYLGFNQARAPWSNRDCRRAAAAALNRPRYVKDFFPGDAAVADSLVPPAMAGSAPAALPAYDPAQARALWAACLGKNKPPQTLTLYVPPQARPYLPDPAGLGEAVRADLAAAGITVTVKTPDWTSAWLPDVQNGRADLFLLGWAGLNGDPDAALCPLLCGGSLAFNADRAGRPRPPDEALAQILKTAQAAAPEARAALYAQAQAQLGETLPLMPLTVRQSAWAYRADLIGTLPSPLENVFYNLELNPAP